MTNERFVNLKELQDGLANFRAEAVLHQLVLQAHRLPQVGVRLTQDVVQLKSNLHRGCMTLHATQTSAVSSHVGILYLQF